MEEPSVGKNRLILVVLVVIAVVGTWFIHHNTSAREAVDETVDAFVPDAEEFERRMGHIEEARQLTDAINARHARAVDERE